ncbi:MAG: S-layer homology domain-containing protein [Acidimicrobiia bacterium]|nr:S-layer homology domain-containing protein [Acidimicrobiia bacterium]MDH5505102.1 S-layer homology domain-containing protein [Acidimicrobiia bacterium]
MRRVLLAILILGLLAAPAGAASLPPGGSFVDDDGNIFEPDIEAIAAVGVTKGCNNERTSFCPKRFVTRGQMAAFLVRALGLTEQDPSINFNDDNESIFEDDIEKLATAGITTGCNSAGTIFCPNREVSRKEMAAFLVRALGLTAQDPSIDFSDDNGLIFEDDIEKLATAGITTGCGTGNTFCPNQSVTREQMAAFLTRALKYPRPTVPPRGETTNGIDLAISEAAADSGCTFAGGQTCLTTITIAEGQSFYFDEGFVTGPWSQIATGDRNAFKSSQVRTRATLNGTELGVVVRPVVVADDVAEKLVTFQFPDNWTGTHRLDITFISEPAGYQMTIRATVIIAGGPTASISEPMVLSVSGRQLS